MKGGHLDQTFNGKIPIQDLYQWIEWRCFCYFDIGFFESLLLLQIPETWGYSDETLTGRYLGSKLVLRQF